MKVALTRKLSFTRGGKGKPTPVKTPNAASGKNVRREENSPTENGSESTNTSEADGPSLASDQRLAPLCSQLSKRHHSGGFLKGHSKRWFQVDDRLGVLYQFTDRKEMERRGARCASARAPRAQRPRAHRPPLRSARAVGRRVFLAGCGTLQLIL